MQQLEQQLRMPLQAPQTMNIYTPSVPNMVASTGSYVGTPTFSKQADHKHLYTMSFVPPNGEQNVPQNVEVKKPAYTSSIQALMQRPGRAHGAISSTIKWDGSTTTFDVYKTNVESHLLQTRAGYILQEEFQ